MSANLTTLMEAIQQAGPLGIYRSEPYLSGTDLLILRFLEEYARSGEGERSGVQNRLHTISPMLLRFSRRMATAGVRVRSIEHLEAGIRALAIAGDLFEESDVLTGLALAHTSLKELGSDSRFYLDREAGFASSRTAVLFRDFSSRAEPSRCADQFGFRATRRGGEFDYERV